MSKEKHNMASCMLSILDSLKLYDNNSLELGDETLSEMMFRKMKGHNIDLNKELGFTHLKPTNSNDIPHSEHRRMESEGVYEEKFGEPNSSSDSDAPKYFNDEWNGKKPKDIQDWEETPFGKSHKKFTTNVGDYDDIENSEYDAISLPKKDDPYIDDDYDY